MAALDGALPRIDAAPGAAPPANRVADALAARRGAGPRRRGAFEMKRAPRGGACSCPPRRNFGEIRGRPVTARSPLLKFLGRNRAYGAQALEAELAAQDEQFTKLANAMSLTASSLDELYARADADGGAAPHQNMIATLAEIERDFKADAADVPSGTRTR